MVAGLALPAVSGVAYVANAGVDSWDSLPEELAIGTPAEKTRILAADGTQIATLFEQNRENVPLDAIPQHVQDAVLAIEDARFYEHNGVDVKSILRAAATNREEGEIAQGGSTITQQYVKNVLVNQAESAEERSQATEQSVTRKLREVRYAMALEKQLGKDEILERYLNIVYVGQGAYGLQAAAKAYFSKPVGQLTIAEGAYLAGLLHAPSAYDNALEEGAVVRRNLVLDRMAYYGYITPEEKEQAQAQPAGLQFSSTPNGCQAAGDYGFYCDYVRRFLEDDPAFGETPEERRNLLYRGGLTIQTPLDLRMQKIVQDVVDYRIPRDSEFASVVVMVEPGTGDVKAMGINRTFGKNPDRPDMTEVPLATTPAFPAGSTFKVFTLVTALEKGVRPSFTLEAPATYTSNRFLDEDKRPWKVTNAGDTPRGGTYDLTRATWSSVNTYYVQLEEKIGVPPIAETAHRMGLTSLPVDEIGNNEGSFTLGARETSPLEMASAYATLAARGVYCAPRPVLTVQREGQPVPSTPQSCERVIAENVADTANTILSGVISQGTGSNAYIGRQAAGKTGTVGDFKAAWFVGYTPQLSAAAMISDPEVPKKQLKNTVVGRSYYSRVYGSTITAPMWAYAMRNALSGQSYAGFESGNDAVIGNVVPDVRGKTFTEAFEILRENGFDPILSTEPVKSDYPLGTIADSDPGPGTRSSFGTDVTLTLSGGQNDLLGVSPEDIYN